MRLLAFVINLKFGFIIQLLYNILCLHPEVVHSRCKCDAQLTDTVSDEFDNILSICSLQECKTGP